MIVLNIPLNKSRFSCNYFKYWVFGQTIRKELCLKPQLNRTLRNMLHNKLNKEQLVAKLESENFKRKTLSFYRYVMIDNPSDFRDQLYLALSTLGCNGRIYVANEGINAQMNVPEHHLEDLNQYMESLPELKSMPIKWAIEENKQSFLKLIVKVRKKIVADGLNDEEFDVTNVGNHLSPLEFHHLVEDPNVIVVDMRNHYESEIGHFKNAILPDVDTFREEVQLVIGELEDKKDQKILLYCTGGVRCEKASAYMRHHGFSDVNQLHGGIIAYAEEIKKLGVKSNFIGKNFVFDERMEEAVSDDIIGKCHQCGAPCDSYVNCANNDCHLLFIQCEECAQKYNHCCSNECKEVLELPELERKSFRSTLQQKYADSQIFRSRLRPRLQNLR